MIVIGSFDIEEFNKKIPAIGVSVGSFDKDNIKIIEGKIFYTKVPFKESTLNDFWEKNVKVLKDAQKYGGTEKQMMHNFDNYLKQLQKKYPTMILSSDFNTFDCGKIDQLFEKYQIKQLRFRRNQKQTFFQDLDLTSFAAGVEFALNPKDALKEGWEWGIYKRLFKFLNIKENNTFKHDHNPQNDASYNLFQFLTLYKHGIKQQGINKTNEKKRKMVLQDEHKNKKKKKIN
jgi:hypothetical protein